MASISIQVNANADDSRTSVGAWSNASLADNAGAVGGFDVSSQMIFNNITIPQGSTINVPTTVTLQAALSNAAVVVNTNLAFEAADSPAQVVSQADFDGRPLTVAAAWNAIGAWIVNQNFVSPSLVVPLQAVVNRLGFISGNPVNLFWKNNGSTMGAFRQGKSHDNDPANAPILDVDFTPPVGAAAQWGAGPAPLVGKPVTV